MTSKNPKVASARTKKVDELTAGERYRRRIEQYDRLWGMCAGLDKDKCLSNIKEHG